MESFPPTRTDRSNPGNTWWRAIAGTAARALALGLMLGVSSSSAQEVEGGARAAAEEWLLDACNVGDGAETLDRLERLGPAGEALFLAALSEGPSPELLADLTGQLERHWAMREALLASPEESGLDAELLRVAGETSKDDYFAERRAAFVQSYRQKAVVALGIVGAEQARVVLERLASDPTAPLRSSAEAALATLAARQ
jgi:hypothetical protein